MEKEYPKSAQRLGVCYSSWRKVHGGAPPKKESFIMNILSRFKRSKKETIEATRPKPRYRVGYILVYEAFQSLRKALDHAVRLKFGKESYVADFSNKEVVIGFYKEAGSTIGPSYQTEKYKKIKYKFVKGVIEFVGDEETVERFTTYENNLETVDLVSLVDMTRELNKALAEKKENEKV